jgi:aspartate/methionine/tyrosine aminotransferase
MDHLLLVNQKLPNGWQDTSIGEPILVRDAFIEAFSLKEDFKKITVPSLDLDYPHPQGYKALIELLEQKHNAPVIITNGAKQGLSAICYALKKHNKIKIATKSPYWALLPFVFQVNGLEMILKDKPENEDCFFLVAPNNPDGTCDTPEQLQKLSQECKDKKITLIHDAAYYSHVYLPGTFHLNNIGDLQVYSFSKLLGLSGLRLGYIVCHNTEFFNDLIEYMEYDTVGVNTVTQSLVYELLNHRVKSYPSLWQRFEGLASLGLEQNKKICQQIDPEKLLVPKESYGMFGWFQKVKINFEDLKIRVAEGKAFGNEQFVRMNLAISPVLMQSVVDRINKKEE